MYFFFLTAKLRNEWLICIFRTLKSENIDVTHICFKLEIVVNYKV